MFLRQDAPRATPSASVTDGVQRALRIVSARLRVVARVDVDLRDVPAVRAPVGRIVQVVLNLLLNATEALAHREKSQNLVAVRTDWAAGRVLIEVSDNGPGLAAAVRGRVFEAGVSHKAGRATSGLGLAISRELVHKMGGEITVSSLPGAGTTFLVALPAA
jgi:signal transduction histidine kinase